MSEWQTNRAQWEAWIRDDGSTAVRTQQSFDPFDDDLRSLLERTPFLGDDEAAPEFDDDDETTVRPSPLRVANPPVSAAYEVRATTAVARGEIVVEREVETTADGASGPLEVEVASVDGTLSVELETMTSLVHPPEDAVEGLFIPTLTRPRPAATPSPEATTPVEGIAPPVIEERTRTPDPRPSSSQTAGEILTVETLPAEASMTSGEISDVAPNPPAPPRTGKIVVAPSVAQVTPPSFDDDDTDELDSTDLVEEVVVAEEVVAEVEPEAVAEVEPEVVVDEVVADEDLAEADARAPVVPPVPPPRAEAAKPVADARRDGGAPPPPKQPPAEPGRASGSVSSETRAALSQLQSSVRGPAVHPMSAKPTKPAGWVDEVFQEHYAGLLRADEPAMAEAEVEFIVEAARFPAGATILDVGCGVGTHAIALARRGYVVTGLDNSVGLLKLAAKANDAEMAGVEFVHGDAREPPLTGHYDGIVCLGTSLGYFDDETNRCCVQVMADLLAPGGRLMIHVFNRDHIIGRLPARSWWQGQGCLVLDEADMHYFSNRLHVHRTVAFEDGRQFEHDIYVRGFTAYDLGRICVDAGLRVLEISGSRHTRGRFYGSTSPEIWLLLEKPGV